MYERPNMLVVTGSYTIGKERIFLGDAVEYINDSMKNAKNIVLQ